ncbi:hypothetical protein BKA56DRAFT_584561 [Ilyonectria sp. MPI-CAGE-AT-0026]|nr:hypothetical protein BKA56DRAFT_584561 [Ilyonectria sp. MPI-CAGE-AT-0026]
MPELFSRFLDLPWELREEIWRLALRPSRPGVQVFGIYNSDEDKHDNDPRDDLLLNTFRHSYLCISAPKWGPRVIGAHPDNRKDHASWTCNNPSTYLIDRGLWTACKESRFIIQREFQCRKWESAWRHHCSGRNPDQFSEFENLVSAMACFKDKDSSNNHYITVFPKQDLFYFQPHDIETLSWGGAVNRYFLGAESLSFDDLENVALEFNPSWAIEVEKARPHNGDVKILDTLAHAAIDGATNGCLDTLWLIDYGLKRNPNVPMNEAPEGKSIFYQGNRRFVEVATDSLYPKADPWEDYYEIDDCWISCGSFIDEIKTRILFWREDRLGRYPTENLPANIGMLACEYF